MAKTLGAGLRRESIRKRIVSSDEPEGWVYALGCRDGHAVKLGETRRTLRQRLDEINKATATSDERKHYDVLVAVRGSRADEQQLQRVVARKLGVKPLDKGSLTEYYPPEDILVGWINWLRQMPFAASSLDDQDIIEIGRDAWLPDGNGRFLSFQRFLDWEGTSLFDKEQQFEGPLAGTAWAFLRDPTVAVEDYFTDFHIVEAAGRAMGGIDIDAASHKHAQRRLIDSGIQFVPRDYYTLARSAFDHQWNGKVWLNPPYGHYEPWFARALYELTTGHLEQLCMISPVHAFNTKVASEFMTRVEAGVILSPTPDFYNPSDPSAKGTNLPHIVVYLGGHRERFLSAFASLGIGVTLTFERQPDA